MSNIYPESFIKALAEEPDIEAFWDASAQLRIPGEFRGVITVTGAKTPKYS